MKPESKDQAFNLYFQTDYSQTKIAELLDVNRKTVYLWVKEGQWEYLKQSARQTPGVLLDQFSRQLVALNESILSRSDRPFPTKEEADIQRKLSLTIKNLRKGPDASERVAEMVRFVELVKTKDMKLLEKLVPILTEFTGQLIPDPDTYMAKMKAQYREEQAARAADKAEAEKYTFKTDPGDDLPPESESSPPENTTPVTQDEPPSEPEDDSYPDEDEEYTDDYEDEDYDEDNDDEEPESEAPPLTPEQKAQMDAEIKAYYDNIELQRHNEEYKASQQRLARSVLTSERARSSKDKWGY